MSIPNKQIGWSQEAILLHDISKQIDVLINQFCECSTTTTTAALTTTTTLNPSPPVPDGEILTNEEGDYILTNETGEVIILN